MSSLGPDADKLTVPSGLAARSPWTSLRPGRIFHLVITHRWDPFKAALNLANHGVPFELAEVLFTGPVQEVTDIRRDYGEVRIQAYGRINGRLFQCVYTWRDDGRTRWIISFRKANKREERRYG